MLKISVVIGTYNQKTVLKKTLEPLFHQTLSPEFYEIQLIDSSSSDGTDKMVEELNPTCRFNYQRVENNGKAYARNIGIKNAKADLILLTDADMRADEKLLEEHLIGHLKKKNSTIEGMTINPDGKPYIKGWLRPWQKLKWAYFLTGNLSMHKKHLLEAGLFDENFKGYGWEDLELGYRFSRMRIPLYYLPAAINHHDHPISNEGMVERKRAMGRSAALFYKKHPNPAIKFFLGMNPLAMWIFHLLKRHPRLLSQASKNQYLLEEYNYRLGLEE